MLSKLRDINLIINNILLYFAGVALVVSMILVVFNGIIRTFTDPFSGVIEVVSWLAAITTAFSLGSAQISKTHVYIDLLFNKFNFVVKKIVGVFTTILGMLFFILLLFHLLKYGMGLKESGVLSNTLRIPYYPFVITMSIGFVGLIFTLLIELIEILFGKEIPDAS